MSVKFTPPLESVTTADERALRLLLETALNTLKQTPPPNWQLLSPHQRLVLRLIAEGYSTQQIAQKRNQSQHAIHSQRTAICRKLGVAGPDCLVRFAERYRAWLLAQPLD